MALSIFSLKVYATSEVSNSEYVKNGMPCIAEICLGDGLTELKKIKFIKVDKPYMNKDSFALIEKLYKGNLKASAPYLYESWGRVVRYFDNKLLSNLSEVIADCGNTAKLYGKFITYTGNPTQIAIELLPLSGDNMTQKWTVVEISRQFPKAISNEQKQEISNELEQRYGSFDTLKLLGQKAQGNTPSFSGGAALRLELEVSNLRNRQLSHPACGGSSKVTID